MRRGCDGRAAFWVMLRLLGLVHAAAFISLGVQARGLWGAHGILPIAEYVSLARAHFGGQAVLAMPSVFFVSSTDAALLAACGAGAVLGLVAAAGFAVGPALLGSWALYLSFVSTGRDFLSFQWDILLLETTFLAAFCAPWRLKPVLSRWAPPWPGVWLLRLLLLKLMVESGLAKLASGDPAWRGLTALTYHYWTQPLPTPLAWYAARLPEALQKASCAVMFALELVLPFAMFAGSRGRAAAAAGIAALMLLIGLTGNYCFFNLLGALLCLTVVDDALLGARAASVVPPLEKKTPPRRWAWPAFAAVAAMSALDLSALRPLYLFNRYGLFSIMTTTRPEIELEGSADGRDWQPYVFRYKPGPLDRRPPIVAPHQPRLDWQMWFAALSDCRDNEWFLRLMERLLQGSPDVSRLFAVDPFAGGPPPRYLRSTVYQYRFAPPGSRDWWTRERVGPYCPEVRAR